MAKNRNFRFFVDKSRRPGHIVRVAAGLSGPSEILRGLFTMRLGMRFRTIGLLWVLMMLAAAVSAQEAMSDSALMARQMESMKLAAPGPEHEMLAKYAGTFDMDMKFYMAPGQDPMVMKGTSTNTMILGGRFLELNSTGNMGGHPMESLTILGFDRRHKEFTSVGFDNHGTYWVTASGTYNEETKSIVMSGTDEDPIFEFVQEYDFTVTLIDDDHFRWAVTFYNPELTQGEDSFTMVEITYSRKK